MLVEVVIEEAAEKEPVEAEEVEAIAEVLWSPSLSLKLKLQKRL